MQGVPKLVTTFSEVYFLCHSLLGETFKRIIPKGLLFV